MCGRRMKRRGCFAVTPQNAMRRSTLPRELDGTLLERRRMVEEVGGNYLGASVAAIELCADKLRLAEFLTTHGIPTISTRLLNDEDDAAGAIVAAGHQTSRRGRGAVDAVGAGIIAVGARQAFLH